MSLSLKNTKKQVSEGTKLLQRITKDCVFDDVIEDLKNNYDAQNTFFRVRPDGSMLYLCVELNGQSSGPRGPLGERIIRKRNFPTDFNHDGKKEGRTVYRGERTNRFYSKREWEEQHNKA